MSEQKPDPELDGPFETLAPEAEEALAEALRAAFDPAAVDPGRHRRILEQALLDPFAPASDDEIRESERLRRALEDDDSNDADARLARALRSATAPEPLTEPAAERARTKLRRGGGRARVVYVAFGAAALALAAAFALIVARPAGAPSAARATGTTLATSRPTGDLFRDRFEPGQTTDRIDRIALARERDLRDNRYTLWGVP
jgi:hypothetical protein